MNTHSYGILINVAGKGCYTTPDSIKGVLQYITRTNKNPKDGLIAWGGLGILESKGIDSVIEQFHIVQKLHTRKGPFGRYIDHEIFSFTPECENLLAANKVDLDQLAREMAYSFYDRDHCQVLYGVHLSSKENAHMHIHFAINTVSYDTGNKRHDNKKQTREENADLQEIIAAKLRDGTIPTPQPKAMMS